MQKGLFLFRFFWAFVLLSGCHSPTPPKKAENLSHSPLILTTIAPHVYFLQRIGGSTIEPIALIPSGANPHSYEPTFQQISKAKGADLFFGIGEGFETKILPVLQRQNPSLQFCDLRKNLPLLHQEEEGSSGQDRHIWLSPKLAQRQAETIAEWLSLRYPHHRTLYQANLNAFLQDLKHVDQEISLLLSSLSPRTILVDHPSFSYFCKDYNLKQLSIEYEEKDPYTQKLSDLLEECKRIKVKKIFIQPQHNQKGAHLFARELNIPLQQIDLYSSNYLETIRQLAQMISSP